MENKRILIIGGTGYIGKALVEELIKEKISFNCLSRNNFLDSRISWVKGDILNLNQLIAATKDINIIIYLAALKKGSFKKCFRTNVIGLKNTITAMKANNVRKIIYFSTKNVLLKKRDNYAETKKIAESILSKSGVASAILRPDVVYGLDKENILSKIISFSMKYGVFIIPGLKDRKFYPVNKQALAEVCLGILRKFKPGVYPISGNQTTLRGLITRAASLSKKKITILNLPLFIFELVEKILPLSLSVFREDRFSSKKDTFFRNLDQDIVKILSLVQERKK